MEYRHTDHPKYDPAVKLIQQQLNMAMAKAHSLVAADFPKTGMSLSNPHYLQQIHHQPTVPTDWVSIPDDGYFGAQTEKAVRCLQRFLYITENGIMGDYTQSMMFKLLQIAVTPLPIYQRDTNKKIETRSDHVKSQLPLVENVTQFLRNAFTVWNGASSAVSVFSFVIGNGLIIYGEKNQDLFLHVNFKKIIADCLLPNGTYRNNQQWFYINTKSIYRTNHFTAFRVSKLADDLSGKFGSLGNKLGITSCLIETKDAYDKIQKGELKLLDIAKLGFDYIDTGLSIALKDVSTMSLTLKEASVRFGTEAAKWRFACKLTGPAIAGSGIVIVGIQMISAFLLGWEIGKWIENKTHWGERSMNYLWELFIGKMVEKFMEWKVNRIVCVKYPDDWTEDQIQEFNKKFSSK